MATRVERPSLFTESPVRIETPSLPRVSLRFLKVPLLIMACAGAGYLGAEYHRLQNPPVVQPQDLGDLDHRKILVDIGDRYRLTNERINDQWKVIAYLDVRAKLHDERIGEIQQATGVGLPKPTPHSRPTVSARLKAQPTPTVGGMMP